MDMSGTMARSRHYARRAWTPRWLADRPRPVRIAVRTVAIVLLTVFAIWLILFVTKGRFLKGPFESVASSTLEREVAVGGDFQLYFAPIDVKFLAEDMRVSNPEWAEADQFFAARLIDLRIRTFPLIFGQRKVKWMTLDQGAVALEWDEQGERNTWTFGDPDAPPEPLELPRIERGAITGTEVVVDGGMTIRCD